MKKGLEGILGKLDSRDWFEKLFSEVFEKKKRKPKIIDYFYASWAGECPRWIQYVMNGMIYDDIKPQSQRRMDNGNYMHARYGDYFESIGKLIAREPSFKKDMDGVFVSGRGDLIIPNEGIHVAVELKSINDKGYKGILTAPKEGDFLQWNLCAKALETLTGIILYENKDSQEEKHHFVNFDEEKYTLVINDFKMVDKCNKNGTLVPKPDICLNPKWCNAKKLCLEDKMIK